MGLITYCGTCQCHQIGVVNVKLMGALARLSIKKANECGTEEKWLTRRSRWYRQTTCLCRSQFGQSWPLRERRILACRRELEVFSTDRSDVPIQNRSVWSGYLLEWGKGYSPAKKKYKAHHQIAYQNFKMYLNNRTFMSKWRTCWRWMNWIPSQIWRMKMAQARSVKTKSSSITLSKSSPPSMLTGAG